MHIANNFEFLKNNQKRVKLNFNSFATNDTNRLKFSKIQSIFDRLT